MLGYCCLDTVAWILLLGYCCLDTVAWILLLGYCCLDTVAWILGYEASLALKHQPTMTRKKNFSTATAALLQGSCMEALATHGLAVGYRPPLKARHCCTHLQRSRQPLWSRFTLPYHSRATHASLNLPLFSTIIIPFLFCLIFLFYFLSLSYVGSL